MNRNDKNKKYAPLNINNVFKGKAVEPQNRTTYKLGAMQNIGKVSSIRRVPPPKWVPSLKAETGISDGRQIISQSSSGWVNPASTQDNCDSNIKSDSMNTTSKIGSDKSQWNSKITNKPFFLIGQEFPSLQSDGGSHDIPSESSNSKELINKFKDADSTKSKIDDLRNRDANLSVSTLNRIDALSISKSSKGDIAATGWAAEDEEPNFDEKIIFSDEESSAENVNQNWQSDTEDGSKSARCDNRESVIDMGSNVSDVWHDPNQAMVMRYSQFHSMQIPVNIQGQFISNSSFNQNMLNRNPPGTIGSSIADEQIAYINSVTEQRNVRNMEYMIAIERARQKKLATQTNRGSCSINEEQIQLDQALMRSRHTSMTSDTTESLNTPIEMGPPGGPPLMHNLHKPHLQPQISPMMHPHNISVISPSLPPQSMIRFAKNQYSIMSIPPVPMEQIPVDTKLMEKFVEFLKIQSNEIISENPSGHEVVADKTSSVFQQEIDVTQAEPERQHISLLSHVTNDKDFAVIPEKTIVGLKENKDNSDTGAAVADLENQRKTKINYQNDEENAKYEKNKKGSKSKNYKEYRQNKSQYRAIDYGGNSGMEGEYYQENYDDPAYDDYNTYKQHYSTKDYKANRTYSNRGSYYSTDNYSSQLREKFPNDYQYKSNSLKLKSSKSKDNKSSAGSTNADTLERDSNSQSNSKKFAVDNREIWSQENDNIEMSDKKQFNKDRPQNRGQKQQTYQTKKFDNRNYKDKSIDGPVPEYSMGFEVKPKESRKKYFNYSANRRYYDYSDYYDYGHNGGEYDYYYAKDYYSYEKEVSYSNSSKFPSNKRHKPKSGGSVAGGSNFSDSWKTVKNQDELKSQKSSYINDSNSTANNQSRTNNRPNNRKSDKRQFSTSKDINNDNEQEEWETASEGGSIKSNSASREVHKNYNRQRNTQTNPSDNKTISNSGSTIENRKPIMNKTGLNFSCNGGNNSFNDNNGNQDGSGGASGSASGARIISSGSRSNSGSQNKSVDSTQNKSVDKSCSSNENRNSDSTFKNCSNNNNCNAKDNNLRECGNIEKFMEINDEENLYENDDSQFKEVLSKATKKIRKQEELKRQKEESRLEQKKLEALQKSKQKLENSQVRKSVNRRDQSKTVTNMRDKDVVSSNSNGFPKWENKVSMQIGSWDNSLADEISTEKKAPPKPIGTPASTVPWNKKVTGSFDSGTGSNMCQHSLSNESVKLTTDIDTICQPFCVSTENSDVNFSTSMAYSSYNSSMYNPPIRATEENNKIESSIEAQSAEITMHETINFEFDVKNINCDKNHRNSMSTDRVQNNDQKLLNDKISSVKTIWDNQPTSTNVADSQVSISSSINKDLDMHTVTVSINQDVSSTRNINSNLVNPSVPNPNVCKVKPQLQHDFKKDHNEIIINSQTFPFRNSPATFLSQSQGNFIPYHRFPDFIADPMHAPDAFAASLISNNQSGMHINYNLQNTHLIDSTLLRQNTQEQMLSNKMNFINQTQSSFYPQQTTTPKLMSNNPAKLPINMDINSAHPPQHHMQQLLLTRQNSLTSMMQPPNPMTIPFIQSAQQPIQAQTPLFPNTPLLGATNFSSQINPFSQTHLQPHYPQFQPNQQMLLNQHHSHPHQLSNHHQKQQLIQGPLSHDQVINTGQSGVFNSVIGPSDISTNTGLPDFNGQPKTLNHHNNIVHGMSGSTFMLPPNLNILVKPSMFGTNSQYNNFPTTIQSNLLSLKNGFEHNNNLKSLDMDHYKHDNSMNDRNIYCATAATAAPENVRIQKPNEDFYQDLPDYENCDMNYEGWGPNLRYSKVDIYAANNLMSTFDFHSQKSPMQFSPLEAGADNAYRNYITPYRDNHTAMPPTGLQTNATNLQYIISPRIKQQYNIDQSTNIINRQHSKYFDNQNYISSSNSYIGKNESNDNNNKMTAKNNNCGGTSNSIVDESKSNLTKEISNPIEKSVTDSKKENSKQLSSYSDNFDEKNQSWSMIEDNRNVQMEDNSSRTGSLKSSNNGGSNGSGGVSSSGGNGGSSGSCGGGGGGGNGGSSGNKEQNTHSPNKHFCNSRSSNSFESQCQYGYDETQLSSQTAESLGKYDQKQLKKVIMKLREGPVMTDKNCSEFDFPPYKGGGGATIPRLMPLQSSRNKQINNNNSNNNNNNNNNNSGGGGSNNSSKSFNNSSSSEINNYSGNNDNVGLGFYTRNRALTPPATQFKAYRNKNNNNRNQNSILPNNTNINSYNSPTATTTTTVAANINRITRQKCDTNNSTIEKSIDSTGDLKMSAGAVVQSSNSMECDNLVLDNIIDSPIL